MRNNIWFAAVLCLASSFVQAEVKAQEVTYKDNGTVLKGYLANDDAVQGKRARMLAKPG